MFRNKETSPSAEHTGRQQQSNLIQVAKKEKRKTLQKKHKQNSVQRKSVGGGRVRGDMEGEVAGGAERSDNRSSTRN